VLKVLEVLEVLADEGVQSESENEREG